jgi:hypothetical protein
MSAVNEKPASRNSEPRRIHLFWVVIAIVTVAIVSLLAALIVIAARAGSPG